jgi:hypothetical protein
MINSRSKTTANESDMLYVRQKKKREGGWKRKREIGREKSINNTKVHQ